MTNTPPHTRRFPGPWTVVEIPGGFTVQDANGLTVAWVYARDDLASMSGGAAWLSQTEAYRIALGISKLPNLLAYDSK